MSGNMITANYDSEGKQSFDPSQNPAARNIVTSQVDPVTGGSVFSAAGGTDQVPIGIACARTTARLSAAPTTADQALSAGTIFYDSAEPTKKYSMNAGKTAFVAVGTTDGKVRPYILSMSAVPVILMSSGAVNASGQFTLTTALPYVPVGTVKVYIFAGVGLAAGLYSATFSSTTVCQLVGSPATTAGAYAGGTGPATLFSFSVPTSISENGAIRQTVDVACNASANNKTISVLLDASTLVTEARNSITGLSLAVITTNRRSVSSQVTKYTTFRLPATTNGGYVYTSVDTADNKAITYIGQLAVATDFLILDNYLIEMIGD